MFCLFLIWYSLTPICSQSTQSKHLQPINLKVTNKIVLCAAMKSKVISFSRSQSLFLILRETIEREGFSLLHADTHNFEIEAMIESRFNSSKHLNARLIASAVETELVVEIRNIGLELKPSRKNQKREIELIRAFSKALKMMHSRAAGAA